MTVTVKLANNVHFLQTAKTDCIVTCDADRKETYAQQLIKIVIKHSITDDAVSGKCCIM